MLGAPNQALFYRQFVSYWSSPESLVIGGSEPRSAFHEDFSGHAIHAMMALDAVTYLPDDILCKVDRAAMAVGLETRVPLLDQAVYELAWRLPLSYKIRKGQSKWILRQVLYKHVPQALIDRPKKGFAVPLAKWLRGPLKDWAQALLEPRLLREQGLFVVEPILQKWREHQTSQRDWSAQLWGILMVQAWLERHQESLALQPKGGV
jgi:asparagine synthase (glutamine-hydrolysing)